MTNRKKRLIWLVILVLVAYSLYRAFSGSAPEQPAPPPAAVEVTTVQPADLPVTYEYSGRAAGSREVEVRARINGILLKRSYAEGQRVKAGDVLFQIEPDQVQAAQQQTQAALVQAERDWKRVSELFAAGAVSTRERDEAQAVVQQARAQNKASSINLDYTTVVAPITGVTSQEAVSEGSLVVANQSLLTRITQLDPIYVNFAYPENEQTLQKAEIAAGKLSLPDDQKLQAEIRFGDGTIYKDLGEINFTDSIVDTATGSINARASVPNAEDTLLPGQFVRVVVKGFTYKNAIAVPDRAVIQGPMGAMVYVVSPDSKAQIRPVKLGALVDGKRIIEEGLKPGDQVISEGMIKTRPDQPVKVEAPKPPGQQGQGQPQQGQPQGQAEQAVPDKEDGDKQPAEKAPAQ